ncbi:metalloregulator ArsR/SmtB family transcription factor [Psychromonas aquatilis]|uniref:Metalloregulator ArsR/SmtB family transcription factor n=1 Tax=Psychromonas aquatilis TaxID=2005072 RepID=A0ABU9GR67_9GAMM
MQNKLDLINENVEEATDFLKIMAHKDRMLVLCLLSEGEMGVAKLREYSNLSQSAFSQHLSVLKKHQLVKVRKQSQLVFYSLADQRVNIILKAMQQAFCPTLTSEE